MPTGVRATEMVEINAAAQHSTPERMQQIKDSSDNEHWLLFRVPFSSEWSDADDETLRDEDFQGDGSDRRAKLAPGLWMVFIAGQRRDFVFCEHCIATIRHSHVDLVERREIVVESVASDKLIYRLELINGEKLITHSY